MTDPQAKIDDGGWANNKSLRFETAQMAMQGLLAHRGLVLHLVQPTRELTILIADSFGIADAMIQAGGPTNGK